MSSLYLCDAGKKCLCVFREKVLNVWAEKFPRLVSREVQVLMADEKFRPDVSSTDCVARSTAQAEKVDESMFDVTDVDTLNKWMHVRVYAPSLRGLLRYVDLSPKTTGESQFEIRGCVPEDVQSIISITIETRIIAGQTWSRGQSS